MEFSVLERILLLQALPKEGSFANLKLLREVRESLSFSEEEHKLLGFRQEGDQTRWNDLIIVDKKTGTPIEIDPAILEKNPAFVQEMVGRNPDGYEQVPAVPPKEVKMGDVVLKLTVSALKALDEQEKLTEGHIPLYERLMDD